MFTVTHEALIRRPVGEVFTFMAHCANDPLWCPPVLSAEQTQGEGPAKGARYRQVAKPGPKQVLNRIEIVEFQPHQHVAWAGSNEMVAFHGRYDFKAVDEGTHVYMSSSLAGKGLLRLLEPIMARASRQAAVEEFENLKQLLESEQHKEKI